MESLCESFERIAARTWAYLDAAACTAVRIGEETLTDLNLVDIQASHPLRVRTCKFTRSQEAANGADWEWWFRDKARFLPIRVQAKKLYPDERYIHLSGPGRAQAATLVAQAAADRVTPLYCFYNWTEHQARQDWSRLHSSEGVDQMGCALAVGTAVKRAVDSSKSVPTRSQLSALQVPWRRLVCRMGVGGAGGETGGDGPTGGGDLPDSNGGGDPPRTRRLSHIASALGDFTRDEDLPTPVERLRDELPDYVEALLTGETAGVREVPARRVAVVDVGPEHVA